MVVAQEQPYYSSLPRKTRRPQKRPGPVVHFIPRRERLVLTGLVLLSFCAAILVVFFHAQVLAAGYQLNKLKKELGELDIQTQALAENISRFSSLERIERVATTKLGMVKPDAGQMILVKAEPAAPPAAAGGQEKAPDALAAGEKGRGNWLIQALVRLTEGRGGNPGAG
ncbi:MAG: cell division protein FtsL [Desulfotomaculales bacterium]